MNLTTAFALLAGSMLLFWCTLIATRLARPPRWTGDTMVMCVIAPAIIFLGVSGGGILAFLIVKGAWRATGANDFMGIGAVLVAAAAVAVVLMRWSRRAPRAVPADVIAMPRPETPQPPRPAPRLGKARKAA
jgi:uncharacterized membrane protein